MILKNEAKTVKEVIRSVLPLIDEAVIAIDKTTVDKTEEVVYRAFDGSGIKPNIHKFDFNNDFAALRNRYIEHCTGDYVFILDGHDILSEKGLTLLLQYKKQKVLSYDVLDFNVIQRRDVDGLTETWFQQPRMFKQHIRYEFAIHNTITHMENRITLPQVEIYHEQPEERYKARIEQRGEMNVEGLKPGAEEGDPRAMYYLAMVYFERGEWKEAIRWFESYVDVSGFEAEIYQAYLHLAKCYYELKDMENYKNSLINSDKVGSLRNEHLIGLGDYYYDSQDYDKALYYYKMASSVRMPIMFLNVEKHFYTWLPWYKIALTYLMGGNPDEVVNAVNRGKVIEPRLNQWYQIEQKLKQKFTETERKQNGFIYFCGSYPAFLESIVRYFSEKYMIRYEQNFNPENAEGADLIWCEWADHNAVAVANFQTDTKKLLRIHAYEVFGDYPNKIDFSKFDHLIFVADHIKESLFNRISLNGVEIETSVIPNFVNLDRFDIIQDKKHNFKIGWAGYIANKKAPTVLLLLANHFPNYEFHVAGIFQELDIEELFQKKRPPNMFLHKWQDNLSYFFHDKSYVVNTSPRESQSLAVMEGMACGCKPLLYDWIGAKEIYGEKFVWKSLNDFEALLKGDWEPGAYRKFIEVNYSRNKILPTINQLVKKLIEEKKNAVKV